MSEENTLMKPPQRRGPIQHVASILKGARKPIKRTHLMYLTNLSHAQLSIHLSSLLEKGLIEKVPYVWQDGLWEGQNIDKRTLCLYVTTPKGTVFIKHFEKICDLLGWSDSLTLKEET